MAITSIAISQDNIINGSNLLPIHSPLVFIADVTYTTTTPDVIHVRVNDSSGVQLAIYKAIPFKDISATIRQFVFIAGEPIRALMETFDDTIILSDVLTFVDDITMQVNIEFLDPDNVTTNAYTGLLTIIHGAAQFGENPNLDTQFNNANDTYFCKQGGFTYVYYYNSDSANVLTVTKT